MDIMDRPRTLLCGHVFCHQCLLDFNRIFDQAQATPEQRPTFTNGHTKDDEECHSIGEESDDEVLPLANRVTCPTCRASTQVQDYLQFQH